MRDMMLIRRLLLVAGVALIPRVATAQTPPRTEGAKLPAGYAGSAECLQCHKAEFARFAATAKGKLLLEHPRSMAEGLGCESCHGPAKQHAQSGGEERGKLIAFGKKAPAPVAERNAACLQCHEKTARTFWKGSAHESRNLPCTSCHQLMHPK